MNRAVFIVLNPVAGNCDPEGFHQVLAKNFADRVETYEVWQTNGQEEAVGRMVHGALNRGYKVIAAAGGDGTVSAVADALAGTKIPMAILPVGTGNLLARDLQIPLDLSEAAALLTAPEATIRSIDTMRVDGRTYISHISLGIYSQIIRQTTPEQKRRFGRMAYIWAALKEISHYPTWRFAIEVDGRKFGRRASMIIVANVSSVGIPPLEWGPNIAPNDGRVDLCIVKARTAGAYFQLLWNALQNQHDLDRSHIEYISAGKQINLQANEAIPIRADGEIIGRTSVSIRVVPHSLQVITPAVVKKKGVTKKVTPFLSYGIFICGKVILLPGQR